MNNLALLFSLILLVACNPFNKKTNSDLSGVNGGSGKDYDYGYDEAKVYTSTLLEKEPYLIYYVVDYGKEAEPKFSAVADFEVSALEKICDGSNSSEHVNFVLIRNSQIIKDGQYSICKRGKLSYGKIALQSDGRVNLGEASSELGYLGACQDILNYVSYTSKEKKKLMSCNDKYLFPLPHNDTSNYPMVSKAIEKVTQEQKKEEIQDLNLIGKYAEFPLASADFLYAFLRDVRTVDFPDDEFIPFIHIKSHGAYDYSITGVYGGLLGEKIKSQEKDLLAMQKKFGLDKEATLKRLGFKNYKIRFQLFLQHWFGEEYDMAEFQKGASTVDLRHAIDFQERLDTIPFGGGSQDLIAIIFMT